MGYESYALRGMLNLPRLADHGLASSECPLLAHSGHELVHRTCPLLGVKRTSRFAMPPFDPPDLMEEGSHGFSCIQEAAIRFVKLGGSMKWRSARNGSRP